MNSYIQISFSNLLPEQQELLIAELAEAGFEGFEEDEKELKAFIPASKYDKQLLLGLVTHYHLQFAEEIIPEQNWNANWESSFQPVVVYDPITGTPWVAIRAGFHEPVLHAAHEIIITPKMSFGTGHHATTYMMVQQMRELNFKDKKVFDFGTGTGILAILAEKLGAKEILAIDNDEWSITNAAENTERNHCKRIRLLKAETVPATGQFDIILANINKNVILEHLTGLKEILADDGILLLSGLLTEDEKDIKEKAASLALKLISISEKNKWISLRFNC